MSPLNVHVNRAPVGGEVTMIEHTPGDFRAAYRDDASAHNERNLIAMPTRRAAAASCRSPDTSHGGSFAGASVP